MLWLYVLAGIIGGLLGGMGMGGGTLLIPILTVMLDVEQQTAQFINLASFIPMSLCALAFHIKNRLVIFKGLLYIVIPAVVMAVAGSFLAVGADGRLLSGLFGGFLCVLGAISLVGGGIKK